jgi:hypothetical protein
MLAVKPRPTAVCVGENNGVVQVFLGVLILPGAFDRVHDVGDVMLVQTVCCKPGDDIEGVVITITGNFSRGRKLMAAWVGCGWLIPK